MVYVLGSGLALSVVGCGDDSDAATSTESGSESESNSGASQTDGSTTAGSGSTESTSAGTMGSASNSSSDTTTTAGSQTSSATDSGDTDDSSSSDGSTTGTMGSLLEVTGTFGAELIDYSCDFTDPIYGTLMCDSGRWFATCRPNPTTIGSIDTFQVWFILATADGTMGQKDYLDSQFGISMGDATAQITPLSPNSLNAVSNSVTVDADADPMQPVSGTFEASWNDDGGQFGSVTGTFSITCP